MWEKGVGQGEQEGLQDLRLLDGLLARGRQDAQCPPGERQEDGCRGSPPEGQKDEGGGAGDESVAATQIISTLDFSSKSSIFSQCHSRMILK